MVGVAAVAVNHRREAGENRTTANERRRCSLVFVTSSLKLLLLLSLLMMTACYDTASTTFQSWMSLFQIE